MNGSEFRVIRTWAKISQKKMLEAMGMSPAATNRIYELERSVLIPTKYIKKLSELTEYNLEDQEVLNELIRKIHPKYKNARRYIRHWHYNIFWDGYTGGIDLRLK